MQASASGMAAPFGPAHHDQPRGAQRFVAEEIVGSRHAILDATHPIVAARIGTGPPRIGVSRVGARQVRRLPTGQPRDVHARGFLTVSSS